MLGAENLEIDTYDTRILAELLRDARISMSELGRRVHLSQPAVAERVRLLEERGIITGYHASTKSSKTSPCQRAHPLGSAGYGLFAAHHLRTGNMASSIGHSANYPVPIRWCA